MDGKTLKQKVAALGGTPSSAMGHQTDALPWDTSMVLCHANQATAHMD